MSTTEISNSDDLIDSRDVIARIEELHELRDNAGTLGDEEREELATLETLAAEGEQIAPDWCYGETLIRETYFVDYVEELLKEIGDLPRDLPGYIAIDWEATARNIRVDYTEVDFDGVTYLVR